MTLYVMDTDHLSLFQRSHSRVVSRVVEARKRTFDDLSTTVVSLQEQFEGRLAQIHSARDSKKLELAYKQLKGSFALFADLNVLDYDAVVDTYFREFRKAGIRIGTQDLRIASIVLSNEGILLTRNLRDFEKVPGLTIQDWSLEA